MSNFQKAIEVVLRHEGGYVNNPSDPGGETNFGLSKCWMVGLGLKEDLKTITKDRAIELYRRYIWGPSEAEKIDDQTVATKYFDMAVNMGQKRATLILQESSGEVQDGLMGPHTLQTVNTAGASLVDEMCYLQAKYYNDLVIAKPQLAQFLKGWLQRAAWGRGPQ